jgi:hypothetical protein
MPVTEMVVGISAGLFFLTGFVFFLRLLQTWLLHRTLRKAIEKDSGVAAGLVDQIGGPDMSAATEGSDDRTGLILIAIGVATAGYTLVVGDYSWMRHGLGASLFPILIGAALLARHFWARQSADRDLAPRG